MAQRQGGEPAARARAQAVVRAWLEEARGADPAIEVAEGAREGEVVVVLPGEAKLRTTVSVMVGVRALSVSAFVVRRPDENHEAFYRWLLERNLRLPGVSFGLDRVGDVYLTGRLPLASVSAEALDDLLGAVLATADGCFNELLALGFLSSMRREWRWRVERGESTRNLEPFRHLLDDGR